MTDRRWSRAWVGWTAAVAASFLALETAAVVQPGRPTLSRHLAFWMGCNPRARRGTYLPSAIVGAAVALAVHIARFGHEHREA